MKGANGRVDLVQGQVIISVISGADDICSKVFHNVEYCSAKPLIICVREANPGSRPNTILRTVGDSEISDLIYTRLTTA